MTVVSAKQKQTGAGWFGATLRQLAPLDADDARRELSDMAEVATEGGLTRLAGLLGGEKRGGRFPRRSVQSFALHARLRTPPAGNARPPVRHRACGPPAGGARRDRPMRQRCRRFRSKPDEGPAHPQDGGAFPDRAFRALGRGDDRNDGRAAGATSPMPASALPSTSCSATPTARASSSCRIRKIPPRAPAGSCLAWASSARMNSTFRPISI